MTTDINSNNTNLSLSPLRLAQQKKEKIAEKVTNQIAGIPVNSSSTTHSLSPLRLAQQKKNEITPKVTSLVQSSFARKCIHSDPVQRSSPICSPNNTKTDRELSLSATPARLEQSQIALLNSILDQVKKNEDLINSQLGEDHRAQKVILEKISTELGLAISQLKNLVPDSKELGDVYVLSGKLFEKKSDFTSAINRYRDAILLYKQNHIESVKYSSILMKMATLCQSLDKVDEAMTYLKEIESIYRSHSNTTTLTLEQSKNFADTYGQIANLLLDKGAPPRDILFYLKARSEIFEKNNPDSIDLAQCYDQIASLSLPEERGTYFRNSLFIQESLSATDRINFFSRIKKIYESYEKSKEIVSILGKANQTPTYDLFASSASLMNRERTKRIFQPLKTSVAQYEETLQKKLAISPSSSFLAASFENIGDVYIELKNRMKGLEYYEKALRINNNDKSSEPKRLAALKTKYKEALEGAREEQSLARVGASLSRARDYSVVRAQSIAMANTVDELLKNLQEDLEDPTISAISEKLKEIEKKNIAKLSDLSTQLKQADEQNKPKLTLLSLLKSIFPDDSIATLAHDLSTYSTGLFLKEKDKEEANKKLIEQVNEAINSQKKDKLLTYVAGVLNDPKKDLFRGTHSAELFKAFVRALLICIK